jgi:hypothetical protein
MTNAAPVLLSSCLKDVTDLTNHDDISGGFAFR